MSHESAEVDEAGDEKVDGQSSQDDGAEGPTGIVKTGRRNIGVVVGTFGVLAALMVINAPFRYVELTVTKDKPTDDFDMVMEDDINGVVTEARWPLRYLVQHDFQNDVDSK